MSLSNEEEEPVTMVMATKYCVIAVMYKVITVCLFVHFYALRTAKKYFSFIEMPLFRLK